MKTKHKYSLLVVVVLVVIFSLMRWNDYREKALIEVLDGDKIEEIHYGKDASMTTFDQVIKDEESIKELVTFFSQYRVEKEGRRDFTSEFPEEQVVLQFQYEDERITLPTLIERDVILIEHDQYTIVNGPVDYKWIKTFFEESA